MDSALLVLLGKRPVPIKVSSSCGDVIVAAGDTFRAVTAGDFVSFYDWLRSDDGRVIGVRVIPLPEYQVDFLKLTEMMHNRSYFEIWKNKPNFLLFFSDERQFDPHKSADQDFGSNRIYVGESRGVPALSLAVGCLEPAQLDELLSRSTQSDASRVGVDVPPKPKSSSES